MASTLSHSEPAERPSGGLFAQLRYWWAHRRLFFVLGGVLLIAVIVFAFTRLGGVSTSLPVADVQSGTFIVSITETGELRATNSEGITAPRVRTNLQIVRLAEKGTMVEKGDTLLVFDGTELQKTIDEKEAEVEIARSNLQKSRASMESNMAQLRASLETSRSSYRQAELRLQQMQFEADIVKEEQQLALRQAEINLEQAKARIKQQAIIDSAEFVTLELRVQQALAELDKAREDLDKLTIIAPQPGLVVYKKIWKGGDYSEVRIGDQPWRGQALLELPDLSQMEVETSVSEIDVSRVKAEQRAEIVLDAFPEKTFTGEVTDVSTLARIDEDKPGEVKVFDVVIRINEHDDILKPGMTVRAEVIVDTVADAMWVPLDAVFTEGERSIVYRAGGGGFKKREVKLGTRNQNFVVVEEGLQAEDRVSLIDPTKPIDLEQTGSGTKETSSNGSSPSPNGSKGKR
jgi:RND family efflux transporter MFP subunit